jgi:hypothetical protein
VLLVVPSLMAMQQDVSKQVRAAGRALRSRELATRLPAGIAAFGALGLFAVFLAPVVITGAPIAALAAALPMLNGGMVMAFGMFVLGLAVWLVLVYFATVALTLTLRRTA